MNCYQPASLHYCIISPTIHGAASGCYADHKKNAQLVVLAKVPC